MAKVEYEYYQSEYLGTKIPASTFDKYERKARHKLSSFTFNRIDDMEEFEDCIKNCICELADAIYSNDEASSIVPKGISSESTDGHSVTYDKGKSKKELEIELYDIAKECLWSTGLLYAWIKTLC